MKGNHKLACGALTVDLLSGIFGFLYLIILGMRETGISGGQSQSFQNSLPLLSLLAIIMVISTLVMIVALPKRDRR